MDYHHLYGNGYPALACGPFWIEFYYGTAQISFREEGETIQTLDGSTHQFIDGYRGIITLSLLNILEDAENLSFLYLIQALNYHRSSGEPIQIFPRYGGSAPRSFICNLPPNIDIKKLSETASGQKVDITMETTQRLDDMPAYIDAMPPSSWNLHDGSTLGTHSGDNLELIA